MRDDGSKSAESDANGTPYAMYSSMQCPDNTGDLARLSPDCLGISRLLAEYARPTWLRCPTCGRVWWTSGVRPNLNC